MDFQNTARCSIFGKNLPSVVVLCVGALAIALGFLFFAEYAMAEGRPKPEEAGQEAGYPQDVSVRDSALGSIFTDRLGHPLYWIDKFSASFLYGSGINSNGMAQAGAGQQNPFCTDGCAKFCTEECAKLWVAFSAPASAPAVGGWRVAIGVHGPQWTYKGQMVFTFINDKTPGAITGNGYANAWYVVPHVLAPPDVPMPHNVDIAKIDGGYRFVDRLGRFLYAAKSRDICAAGCASVVALSAPIAGHGIGDWTPVYSNDGVQWAYRGKLVFVSRDNEQTPPSGVQPLRP